MKKFLYAVAVAMTVVSCVYPDSSLPTAEKADILNIATGSVTVPSSEGTTTVKIVSTTSWSARLVYSATANKDEWCSMNVSSGAGNETAGDEIIVTYKANPNFEDRAATLHVSSPKYNKSITITQKQQDVINVTTDQFNVPAEGDIVKIEIKSNVKYDTVFDTACGWIRKVDNDNRAYATQHQFYEISPNQTGEERQTEVKLTYKDITKTITIIQAAAQSEE